MWTLPFIMVIVINVFNGLSSYMINPVMSSYLVDRGLDFQFTGLVSSLMSWVALVFRPFSGAASDRFNKKKMMLISYGIIGCCMLMYQLSHNITLSIVIRVIHGIAFAVSGTVALAFATSFVPSEMLAEGLGYISLGNLIGQMFGPQLGSMIADAFGLNINFLVAGSMNAVAVLIIYFLPYVYQQPDNHEKRKIRWADLFATELIIYVVLVGILSLCNGVLSYFLKSYGDYKGIANISVFYTVISVCMMVFKPIAGRIHDRKGLGYILYPGFLLTALSMVLISRATSLVLICIAAVLKAMGQGCSTPAIQAECVKTTGRDRSGVAVSTCYIGQDIGNALGPTLASYMIVGHSYEYMFNINALFLVGGFVIFLVYRLTQKKKAA